ncbi:MAG: hypothetical protein JWP02_1140 [Acidimicrobiales bacterium]|nr:hypothetical protein [Acidimicrobiales bacterium]
MLLYSRVAMGELGGDEAAWAVAAHGLLGSMAVVVGSVSTVLDKGACLSETEWTEFLSAALAQAEFVSAALCDLIRGAPTQVVDALDSLPGGRLDVRVGRS